MGKRSNIRDTRRATEALVRYAERDSFVAQGLLPANASLADANVLKKQAYKDALASSKRQREEGADPKGELKVSGAICAVLVVVSLLVASPVMWWITGIVIACSIAALIMVCNDATNADARHQSAPEGRGQ